MTSGLRAVEAAVENVKEAVGQAVHSVLTHIPGTPEHAVVHDLKEVEKQQKKGVQFQEGAESAAAQPTTRGKPVRKLGRQATPWIGTLPDMMEPEAGCSTLDHIAEDEEGDEEEEGLEGEAAAEEGQQKGVRFQEGGEGVEQPAAASSRRKKLGRQATPWIGSFPDVEDPEEEEEHGGPHSLDQIAEEEEEEGAAPEEGAEQQQQQQQPQQQQPQQKQQKGVRFQEGAGQQLGSEHRSKSLTRKATPWLGSLVTEAEPSTQHAEHAEHASLGQIEEGPEEAEEAGEGEQPKGVRFEEGVGQPNGATRSKSLTRQPTPWIGALPDTEEQHDKSVRFAADGEEQISGQPEGLPKSRSLTRKPTPYIGAIQDAEPEAEGLDRLSLSETAAASKPAKP